jgi:hypothetical protein
MTARPRADPVLPGLWRGIDRQSSHDGKDFAGARDRSITDVYLISKYRTCSAAAPRGAALDDPLRTSFAELGALPSGDKIESLESRAAADMLNAHNTIAVSAMRFQILNTSFLVLNMKTHVSYEARHYENVRHHFLSRI